MLNIIEHNNGEKELIIIDTYKEINIFNFKAENAVCTRHCVPSSSLINSFIPYRNLVGWAVLAQSRENETEFQMNAWSRTLSQHREYKVKNANSTLQFQRLY